MRYCFNAEKISLNDLQERIKTSDLVPSRSVLLEGLDENLKTLEKCGLNSLSSLRSELKDNKRLFALADRAGLDRDWLALLRREFESYFPKPCALKEFDWFDPAELAKLEAAGLHNAADLLEHPETAQASGIDAALLKELLHCADLTRIQWINPTAARMLADAGYETPAQVAAANPDVLCETLMQNNQDAHYFKGNIGLRDIKRLVDAAKYITLWY